MKVEVFSFKAGLLSRMGHDLRLVADRATLEISPDRSAVIAEVDLSSLRVVSAVVDGRDAPDALSAADRAQIDASLSREVLDVPHHPRARFVSRRVAPKGDGFQIDGELSLHGVTRPLSVDARREGAELVARFAIDQPAHGIKPFSAALGALKVKPEVRVVVRAPS